MTMTVRPLVFLVDETEFFLGIEKQFLRNSNVKVVTMQNADAAFEMARTQRPALIFIDRGAPDLEGVRICAKFKSTPELRTIPIVLVAEEQNQRERDLCLKAGCDGLLTKPLDRKEFLSMGRRYLPSIERREQRVLCYTTVFFKTPSGSEYGKTVDISAGGLFIETSYVPVMDDRLFLAFNLPNNAETPLELEGRVVWINPHDKPVRSSFPTGFAVEFVQPGLMVQNMIRKYVDEHSPDQDRIREGQWINQWQPNLPSVDTQLHR